MSNPTIGLNLIMKNEAHVLPRLLNTIYPILDWYTVVDTGSTDNSKQIVKDFFDSKNIPGELHDYPTPEGEEGVLNFCAWRNYAIEKMKGNADYGFMIDCDEELVIDSSFNLKKFKQQLDKNDSASSMISYNNSRYARKNFFSTNKKFQWVGKVHEYLQSSNSDTTFDVEGLTTVVHSDGASWKDQKQKYLSHIFILEKEVALHNDPRDVFYLAQSYYTVGENLNSIKYYRKRVLMENGFFEEQYYSQLMIGFLLNKIDAYPETIIFEWLKCSALDNLKAEHLLHIVSKLQDENQWESSYIFSKYAVETFHGKNPYPSRRLFLDHQTYDSSLLAQHIKNCQATKRDNEVSKYMNIESTYDTLCKSPSDINEHLPVLKEYAAKYSHITEMGMRWGTSTHAFMAGKPKVLISYDINSNECINVLGKYATDNDVKFIFIKADVLKIKIDKTDVLFIDTLHNCHQLYQELKLHADRVKHAIIFHDTTTFGYKDESGTNIKAGLRPAIEEFLATNTDWEIKQVFENNNGLTIIEKYIDKSKPRRIKFIQESEMAEVDICIISNAKTTALQLITEDCLESLVNSEKNIKFNIFIVESNKQVFYNYPNTKTIYTDLPFGYHRYLNLAVNEGKAPYVVLCNNDLIFSPGWASEIIQQMKIYPDLLSASPYCPEIRQSKGMGEKIIIGYKIRQQVNGWCIFQQRKIYGKICQLDEQFQFWFCDNDYAMELQSKGIQHALVVNSIVHHHEKNLGKTGETVLSDQEKYSLTSGQRGKFMAKWYPPKPILTTPC